MLTIFTLSLFTSATLLFLVQPMFAKMVLPKLGGTPAVWITCMVFYQRPYWGLCLYLITSRLGWRQLVLHLVTSVSLPIPPIGIASLIPSNEANPDSWLFMLLLSGEALFGNFYCLLQSGCPYPSSWLGTFCMWPQTWGHDCPGFIPCW
jgi:hypothetical protein